MRKVRINITKKCNIKCTYCYLKPSNHMMDLQTYTSILARTRPDRITLSGGEPFLHPLLYDFIGISLSYGSLNIVSNGTLIEKNMVQLKEFKKNLSDSDRSITISISLDGTTKCEMEAIRKLVELGYKLQVYIYPFDTDYTDIVQQINKLPQVDAIQILFPVSLGRNADTQISKRNWIEFIERLRKDWGQLKSKIYLQYGFSEREIAPEECNEGNFFDSDGTEYNCCLLAEVISNGNQPPYQKCKIHERQGCLALLAVHGKDYRLAEDPFAPCPIYTVKESFL